MTDHRTERDLATAMHDYPAVTPDLDRISTYAVRTGTRARRARHGLAALTAAAVVGVGVVAVTVIDDADRTDPAVHVAAGGAPSETDTAQAGPATTPGESAPPTESPTPFAVPDAPGVYAVLAASGWSTDLDSTGVDDKLYYVGPDGATASLNWRPADTFAGKWEYPGVPADAVMDDDPAKVVDNGTTVVGPVKDGRFLTLHVTGVTREELVDLASQVYRR
jgi:hypothetical protein